MNAKLDVLAGMGVEVQAISTDTKFSHKRFVETEPILKDLKMKIGADPTGEISIDYGVSGLPVTFFVSRKGDIVRRWVGAIEKEVLIRAIDEIMK